MLNPTQLEDAYKIFSQDFKKWVPDGILSVDLKLLNELGILRSEEFSQITPANPSLEHYFHVIETPEKVTLVNEQFAIWIVPSHEATPTSTLTYIAWVHSEKPHLELVFQTSGVYNSPKYVLKVLHHFLSEVIDTEETIASIHRNSQS